MIRFCDKEVCCVTESEIDRQQLLAYFLNGHRNELVCILDDKDQFVGSITYHSLLENSIIKDYLVLNADVWQNGRRYFRNCQRSFGNAGIIPVLDREHHLICFAWQDDEANRELRMLDELMEQEGALGFRDVFPEYDCVIINGCNELAWRFVQYLKTQNILIRTTGELWKELGIWEDAETLDYKCLTVYGEGLESKCESIELRDSVSADFEYIDRIYEANILRGIICDAEGDKDSVFEILRRGVVGILDWDETALKAYDLLLEHGIDICCFISEDKNVQNRSIFDKRIVNRREAESTWENIIIIQTDIKSSAWGFGEVDRYHYLGYKRNKRFFLLQDYAEIPDNGLKNIIKHMLNRLQGRLVLTGDMRFCLAVKQGLDKDSILKERIAYCNILEEHAEETVEMFQVEKNEICQGDFCLLLLPKYYACVAEENENQIYRLALKKKYEARFEECGIHNFYSFFEDADFIKWAWVSGNDSDPNLRPGKIIIGSINYYSGNIFFGGILDNHPNIIMLQNHESFLYTNLYALCIRLATVKSQMVLPLFWKLYDEGSRNCVVQCEFPSKDIFNYSMSEFLVKKETFTSQELFVMIHISYAKAMGKKVRNIADMTIYWEPHNVPRDKCEEYAKWLDGVGHSGYIVNVVRNAYIRAGSNLKFLEGNDARASHMLKSALDFPNKAKKEYSGWKRIVMRFEDLKCKPIETMHSFCEQTGINWADEFLDVRASYKGVTAFDLTPVFRNYEEYLSGFDRFRISLITGPWQKQHGYPYVNSRDFSRRELKEMFLKKFRFENDWVFYNDEQKLIFLKWRKRQMDEWLWIVHKENFGEQFENKY